MKKIQKKTGPLGGRGIDHFGDMERSGQRGNASWNLGWQKNAGVLESSREGDVDVLR